MIRYSKFEYLFLNNYSKKVSIKHLIFNKYAFFSNSKSVRFAIFNGLLKFSNSGGTITKEKLKELYKYVSFLGGVTLLDALPVEHLEQKIYLKLFDLA